MDPADNPGNQGTECRPTSATGLPPKLGTTWWLPGLTNTCLSPSRDLCSGLALTHLPRDLATGCLHFDTFQNLRSACLSSTWAFFHSLLILKDAGTPSLGVGDGLSFPTPSPLHSFWVTPLPPPHNPLAPHNPARTASLLCLAKAPYPPETSLSLALRGRRSSSRARRPAHVLRSPQPPPVPGLPGP